MSTIYENTVLGTLDADLFDPTRWPYRPYCTDDLQTGLRIRPFKTAIEKVYIQINPPHLRAWSAYDIDRGGGALAWEGPGLPEPSWIATNPANAHSHIIYGLSAPVLTTSMDARQAVLRYYHAIECAYRAALQADDGYSGLITKNPAHSRWRTCQGARLGYELGELAAAVDLRQFRVKPGAKVLEVGLGRNCTVFDFCRLWAYKKVREYKTQQGGYVHWLAAVYARCLARNGDFSSPMDARETYAIAKSIAHWVWHRFDLAASDAKFSKLQAFRRASAGTKDLINTFKNHA